MKLLPSSRLLLAVVFCAGPAFAEAEGPAQFDLICRGTIGEPVWAGDPPKSFTTHFRIDLKRKAFCSEEYCGTLSEPAGPWLAYHCAAVSGGKFCGQVPNSTAGPFILNEDFIIDRSNGSFHRTSCGLHATE